MSNQLNIPPEMVEKLLNAKTIYRTAFLPLFAEPIPPQTRWRRMLNWLDQVWWEIRTGKIRRAMRRVFPSRRKPA